MWIKNIVFLAAAFVLLWNSGFIGADYGLPYAGPFTLLFWRYLALSILLLLYLCLRKRFSWPGWRMASQQMLVGALAHGVWLACVLIALDHDVPAGIVALVVALQPLATGAFSGRVTGEKTSLTTWIGLLIGFLGVGVTLAFRINYQSAASVFGHLIPLGSVIAITVATLIQRRVNLKRSAPDLPLDLSLFYQSAATALVLILPAWLVEQFATNAQPAFIYVMTWLILGVSLGAYALMWKLLQYIDAASVASLFYLGPPVTMLMAWLAFGDTVVATDLAGLAIVFVGIFITYRRFNVGHTRPDGQAR